MNHEPFDRPRRKAVALDPHPLCHTALATLLAMNLFKPKERKA